jgi:hypothetical protein
VARLWVFGSDIVFLMIAPRLGDPKLLLAVSALAHPCRRA